MPRVSEGMHQLQEAGEVDTSMRLARVLNAELSDLVVQLLRHVFIHAFIHAYTVYAVYTC